jgi:tetratricopeptide (TPR) repeat protein
MVANLGRPPALVRATRVREQAAEKLGDWSRARYLAESADIDRLLDRGDLPGAHAATQQLLRQCLAAGETTYPEAAYDVAMAHLRLGRVLKRCGAAEAALAPLSEAQRRFQRLADAGAASAERVASVAIVETGDCLRNLGRLDEAARAYEESIERASKLDDRRQVAVNKGQLGTLRMYQKRYREALQAQTEARDTFEALGEPRMVATAWHQIGLVHEGADQFEPAEQAYRQSLAIKVRENNLAGQAPTLHQLGILYRRRGRLEESVVFYKQAAEIHTRLGDLAAEGGSRSNLAIALMELGRHGEARRELQRAIECRGPYGHAAEPWKTWANLEQLERATGHAEAARAARQQAIRTYLAYRRAGGVSQRNRAPFALVTQAIQQHDEHAAQEQLGQHLSALPDAPPSLKALIAKLQRFLGGDRDPALTADPDLEYADAVDLQLLIESLPPP